MDKFLPIPSEADAVRDNHKFYLDTSRTHPQSNRDTKELFSTTKDETTGIVYLRIPESHQGEEGLLSDDQLDALIDELPAHLTEGPEL